MPISSGATSRIKDSQARHTFSPLHDDVAETAPGVTACDMKTKTTHVGARNRLKK